MIEIVSDLVKALNKYTPCSEEPIHHSVSKLIEESNSFWKIDYTIAIAKDNSKEKVANFMVCNTKSNEAETFSFKREHDFWKKLDAQESHKAVVEFSLFVDDSSMPIIEKEGRDIMRSRKEVPSVAALGFIWIARVSPSINIDAIFQLYFKEDYITLNQDEAKYYIGWSEKLKEMDMRNFVSDPSVIY